MNFETDGQGAAAGGAGVSGFLREQRFPDGPVAAGSGRPQWAPDGFLTLGLLPRQAQVGHELIIDADLFVTFSFRHQQKQGPQIHADEKALVTDVLQTSASDSLSNHPFRQSTPSVRLNWS